MRNTEHAIELVAACPFVGFALDEEPYPRTEIVESVEVELRAQRLGIMLSNRMTDEQERRDVIVLYADDQPISVVPAAEEEDGDGS